MKSLLEYLKNNPHEEERFNQCFNCRNLNTCDDSNEDENGMCLNHIPLYTKEVKNESICAEE